MNSLVDSLPPTDSSTEVSVSISDAYEKARTDINFFAALCMPTVCVYSLPLFYTAIWQLIVRSTDEKDLSEILRFALGLPRGHAKTTFLKILIVWLIVYDKISFALIVCSNSDLAEQLLADINDILSSSNVESVYGNWAEALATDSADTKKAAYHGRSVVLVARGWSAGIRGINLKNQRPDFIFCDDVQTRQNDESPTDRQKLLRELVGTIFKAIAPRGRRIIVYVGNMYSEDCILNQFKNSSSWISMVTGAILETGEPLWPALFSISSLKESYEHDEQLGLSNIWFAEVMNDPQSALHSLLPNPIPPSPLYEIVDDDGAFITIDPAGYRKASDDNVIVVHKKFDNKVFTVKTVKGIFDPSEVIQKALSLAIEYNVSLIGIEAVAYQQTLCFWFNHFMRTYAINDIVLVELSPHGRSKEARIRQYVAELYKGTVVLHDNETRRDYNWQGSMYKIGKKDNKDDLLDAIAYTIDIRNEYWHLITPKNSNRFRVDHSTCSVSHNSCF